MKPGVLEVMDAERDILVELQQRVKNGKNDAVLAIHDDARAAVLELVEAVESERISWANEGKHPGWIGRVIAAKQRTNAALARVKGTEP